MFKPKKEWFMQLDLTGKIAVVTGGAGGLGRGVSRTLADAGALVIVADRHRSPLVDEKTIFSEIVDLLDETKVEALFARVEERHGGVDILVNLVGGFTFGGIGEASLDDLDQMYRLNVRPVFAGCKAAFQHMAQRGGGRIVNVGARPAVQPAANLSAYSAAKAAVVNLTQTLALEGKSAGIAVNAILPSVIDTPANREAMPDADPALWVTPESLAGVILFLCTSAARDVSGAVIPVYGRS
jgi:NAD(P)-dependent dehydrogenase (short-subunit alcohol dehydrogenase family)